MENTYLDEMKKNIDKLIEAYQLVNKKVFAFGHCNATEKMIDYLACNGISVDAILDNNKSKQGMNYKGTIVYDPRIIQAYNHNKCFVLIAAKAYESMAKQLRSIGYGGNIIKVVDYNSFAEYSLSEEVFYQKKARVLSGADTLKKIRERYPKEYLVICPYNALGDVYQALSFLPEYCCKNKIKDTVIIVVGNACLQVAELFNVNNLLMLDRIAMDELVQAVIFLGEKNCIIAHHDRPYTNDIIRYLNKRFLSFEDFYKCGVYGIGKDAVPVLPTGNQKYVNADQIQQGNTVIIAPYAKSMVNIPYNYWEKIAGYYQKKGYIVCTNVANGENPIERTKPLSIPINQIISAVEYAGIFIGIRSGLCDILTNAQCRKIVVFPDCFYSTTNVKVYEFFSMPGWEQIIYKDN